jgi:hypothetical protein
MIFTKKKKYCNFVKNMSMSTIELKNKLIKRIREINDSSFLEAIKIILDSKVDNKVYQLTSDQKDAIIESKKQIANGELHSNAQVNEEFQKWVKEV